MEKITVNPNPEANEHIAAILALFETDFIRLAPAQIEKLILKQLPAVTRKQIRTAIKNLVSQGILLYATEFSTTYLMPNPVLETRCLLETLLKKAIPFSSDKLRKPIQLSDGVSFGIGDHPTTLLCIEGLAISATHLSKNKPTSRLTALDVGTGNGILSIAALSFGFCRTVALDIDPVACTEAKNNVKTNGFDTQVLFFNGTVEAVGENKFDVVMANLRMPTLKGIFPQLCKMTTPNGTMVLSGFRPEEEKTLEILALMFGKSELWAAQNKNWAAVVLV